MDIRDCLPTAGERFGLFADSLGPIRDYLAFLGGKNDKNKQNVGYYLFLVENLLQSRARDVIITFQVL